MGNNQIILNKVPVLLSGIAPLLLCVCFCLCVRRMCMCAWFCVWRMSACLWFYVCDVCAQFPASSKTFLLLWTQDDCMWQKCTMTCIIKQFHLLIFPSGWKANISILLKSASLEYYAHFPHQGLWNGWSHEAIVIHLRDFSYLANTNRNGKYWW